MRNFNYLFITILIVVLLFSSITTPVSAWNYTLNLKRDKRLAVVLGVFGHSEFGRTQVTLTNLILEADRRVPFSAKVWLELRKVSSISVWGKMKQQVEREDSSCSDVEAEDTRLKHFLKFLKAQPREEDDDLKTTITFTVKEAGLYALVYARCISPVGGIGGSEQNNKKNSNDNKKNDQNQNLSPSEEAFQKMKVGTTVAMRISQWNPKYISSSSSSIVDGSSSNSNSIDIDSTYLSVGETPLPTIYGVFAVLFAVGTFFWYREINVDTKLEAGVSTTSSTNSTANSTTKVTRIHHAMLLVAILKTLTLFLQSAVYAHRNSTGGTGALVDVIFVIVAAAKTAILFVIVILLGSGWSISRASLSERERQLIVTVLVVQVIVNIAIATIEEGSPAGTETVSKLRLGLRIADLFCAFLVLVPIISRAKTHHEQSIHGGDKSATAASRLQTFRSFYIATFLFLYFTRIVVPYLESHLSYLFLWVPHLLYEIAAVIFYWHAAKLFHPSSEAWVSVSNQQQTVDDHTTNSNSNSMIVDFQPQRQNSNNNNNNKINPNDLEELELN